MPYDVVIRGGSVVDGTGAPRRSADIGIADGRITAQRSTIGSNQGGRRGARAPLGARRSRR